MLNKNSIVALFDQNTQAEEAVKQLQLAGLDMKAVSIVTKEYRTEENVARNDIACDRINYYGKTGAFWGIDPVIAAGPIVAWIVAAFQGAVVVDGISAICAGLYSGGIPEKNILQYEASLKAGKFMLLVHGTVDEVTQARDAISTTGASETNTHLTKALSRHFSNEMASTLPAQTREQS